MQIGFLGLLGLLFIGLKLGGVIAWSWWLVLLPLYIGLALTIGVWAVLLVCAVIMATIGGVAKLFSK